MSGREKEARAVFQELLNLAKFRYVAATDFAVILVGLSELDEALDWLDKAYEERSSFLIFITLDAILDPLRKTTRFWDLVRRIGLPNVQA